jgi:hypothetical protein
MTPRARAAWVLGVALAGVAVVRAEGPAAEPGGVAPSTAEMAAFLKERAAQVDPMALPFGLNERRAEGIALAFARAGGVGERLNLRFLYAAELVNADQTEKALQVLDILASDARANDPEGWKRTAPSAAMLRALAYLRTGERDNCCARNSGESCLLPIHGGGVHVDREGSTRAIEALEDVLGRDPDDLRARWLLNIAHMTLGGYPDKVPPHALIAPSVFAPEYPLPRFDNVAREAGLVSASLAGGAVVDDLDGDGRLDVMVSSMALDGQMRFFHNKGDGTFEDRTEAAGLVGEVGGLNMTHADYDNDGDLDVLVLRGGWMQDQGRFPMSLLRNDGHGTFTDVTRAAGLFRLAPSQTATWLDYDGDGRLDLYVGNESTPRGDHPCELYHNNGDGTFTETAREAGVDVVAFVKGVVSGDYDNDGRPDLYLSVQNGSNRLFHNDGPGAGAAGGHFTEVGARAGVDKQHDSFSTFFFDYDNDGWLDLFVTGYNFMFAEDVAADYLGLPTSAERNRLYRNKGDGTFEDVTQAAHLYRVVPGMGINYGDLDNDGWLDFYQGTGNPELSMVVPNRMFRNEGGRVFQDVTTAGNFGHLQKGHAIAFADLDDDGDQDVFEEMGGAYSGDKAYAALYRNPGSANGWLSLELQGVRSNRGAVGARVKVMLDTPAGPRVLHRVVSSGGSFGESPLRLEIGLGDARTIASVEVFWPVTGQTQKISGLESRHRYRVREGSAEPQELALRPVSLGGHAEGALQTRR